MRPCVKRGVTGEAVAELKPTEGASRRLAGAALAAAALMLAACTASAPPVETPASLPPPAIKPAEAEISPATQREHQRILAAYGGVYNDPRAARHARADRRPAGRRVGAARPALPGHDPQFAGGQRLRAADRPALCDPRPASRSPTTNPSSPPCSSHEMAHVIARHAAIREEQARQAALVSRVVTDVLSDPADAARWRSPSRRSRWRASRARRNSKPTASASASPRAPATIPMAPSRFLTSMGRNAELGRSRAAPINPRSPDFLSSHPATPERVSECARSTRASSTPRRRLGRRTRQGCISRRHRRARLRRGSERRLRARPPLPASAARLHLHRARRFQRSTTPRRRCSASRMAATRRCGSTSCACRPTRSSTDYLTSGWIENIDPGTRRGGHHQRLSRRHRDRQGRPMGVPALRRPLRQRRLSLHLRRQAPQPRNSTAPSANRSARSAA